MLKKKVKNQMDITVIGRGTVVGAMATGDVFVGGCVEGNLRCANVTLTGTVDGNIFSEGKVVLQNGSKVSGSISCMSIEIEEGTVFQGTLSVGILEGVKETTNVVELNRVKPTKDVKEETVEESVE